VRQHSFGGIRSQRIFVQTFDGETQGQKITGHIAASGFSHANPPSTCSIDAAAMEAGSLTLVDSEGPQRDVACRALPNAEILGGAVPIHHPICEPMI
jgi:hypothetical protein